MAFMYLLDAVSLIIVILPALMLFNKVVDAVQVLFLKKHFVQ